MENDVELEDKMTFDASAWIGTGKKIDLDTTPLHVLAALLDMKNAPDFILDALPQCLLSVPELLAFKLPRISNLLPFCAPHHWFSKDPPTNLLQNQFRNLLLARSVPSSKILGDLEAIYMQQILDGVQSIVDPRYNNGRDRLPLWLLGSWRKIHSIWETRGKWQEAHSTVREALTSPAIAHEFSSLASFFDGVGWDQSTNDSHLSTADFACVLQDKMVNDNVTQAMIASLRGRLEHDETKNKDHYICPSESRFYLVLKTAYEKNKLSGPRMSATLQHVLSRIESNPKLTIWFVVLHRQHEVPIRIDCAAQTISYGDSLPHMKPPSDTMEKARLWLLLSLGEDFEVVGRTVLSGTQEDGISCIPATMNAISSATLDFVCTRSNQREIFRR
ncbi:hypothetical protein GGX14DRAFT_366525 [Mycena pura]|uniref:Uncharacterized protein n=1 Tax=Mycena pura TaxID=153505 RepID=A0AAD6VAN8_9AGAR|nr:hypothetical protein GGX14DRAFT_366525 [Mycena pura]